MGKRPVSVYEALTSLLPDSLLPGEGSKDDELAVPDGCSVIIDKGSDELKPEDLRFYGDEEMGRPTFPLSTATLVCDTVRRVLRCPECHGTRTLTISFPGLEQKEQEIGELMAAVWQSVGSRTSTICTVGFSGNSDREVVRFLASFAQKQKCHWFDWGRAPRGDGRPTGMESWLSSETAVCDIAKRYLGCQRFHRILPPDGAVELSGKLPSPVRPDPPGGEVEGARQGSAEREVMADMLWVESANEDRVVYIPSTDSHGDPEGSTPQNPRLRASFQEPVPELTAFLSKPNRQMADLLSTSQLAMKDYWWNPVVNSPPQHDPRLHSRMHHSLGFLRVAEAWFDRLDRPNSAVAEGERGLVSQPGNRDLLRIASLTHDVGHGPFSHLLEEVFGELHWTLDGHTPFSHEELTRVRIWSLLRNAPSPVRCSPGEVSHQFTRLTDLLDGVSGRHWLDAIVNGPFDADKIDYVFRDQRWR